jgi:hypothetical protein
MQSVIRFAVTWLAAWCQVVGVATMPLGPLVAGLGPLGDVPICHADADNGQPNLPQPPHPGHACVLCTVCQSHGGSIALLAPASAVAHCRAVSVVRFVIAQPRAPPPPLRIAAQPRGPPSLI